MVFVEINSTALIKSKLSGELVQLKNMYALVPFPSDANIAGTRTNVMVLNRGLRDMLADMSAGQVTVTNIMPPLDWLSQLRKTQVGLKDRARKAGVDVSPKCAFAFENYDNGVPPKKAEHIERLTKQLVMVDSLCRILYDCGIKQLTSIERRQFENMEAVDVFASLPPSGGSETNSPVALFTREHFRFTFRAKETALFSILNSCALHSLFIVVTDMEIIGASGVTKLKSNIPRGTSSSRLSESEGAFSDGLSESRPAGDDAYAAAIDARPKDERIVSGRSMEDPASVIIDFDVFSFTTSFGKDGKP